MPDIQGSRAPLQVDPHGHGSSTAAWVAVCIIMLGALVMSIAVVAAMVWLFVVGAVVALVGAVSGKVLSGMGFGPTGHH
jgi:hypothetical protein